MGRRARRRGRADHGHGDGFDLTALAPPARPVRNREPAGRRTAARPPWVSWRYPGRRGHDDPRPRHALGLAGDRQFSPPTSLMLKLALGEAPEAVPAVCDVARRVPDPRPPRSTAANRSDHRRASGRLPRRAPPLFRRRAAQAGLRPYRLRRDRADHRQGPDPAPSGSGGDPGQACRFADLAGADQRRRERQPDMHQPLTPFDAADDDKASESPSSAKAWAPRRMVRPGPRRTRIDPPGDDGVVVGLDRQLISSANIACGAHAGNEATMRETVALARRHGVVIGAHPGYPDRENFGRVPVPLTDEELSRRGRAPDPRAATHRSRPEDLARESARRAVQRGRRDAAVAKAIVTGVKVRLPVAYRRRGLRAAGFAMADAALAAGLRVVREGFVDRAYERTERSARASSRGRSIPIRRSP